MDMENYEQPTTILISSSQSMQNDMGMFCFDHSKKKSMGRHTKVQQPAPVFYGSRQTNCKIAYLLEKAARKCLHVCICFTFSSRVKRNVDHH